LALPHDGLAGGGARRHAQLLRGGAREACWLRRPTREPWNVPVWCRPAPEPSQRESALARAIARAPAGAPPRTHAEPAREPARGRAGPGGAGGAADAGPV